MTESEKFKLKDIFWSLILPVIVGLIIIALPTVVAPWASQALGADSPLPMIVTYGLANMVVLAIPLLLGLGWNKWAGGAAGFLMGGLYYVASAGLYSLDYNYYGQPQWNFFRDVSMLGYIVNAILVGYIAGALNNQSSSFKRMLGASLTACITTGLLQYFLNYQFALKPARDMLLGDPVYAFFLSVGGMIPMLIIGFVVPIIAKISYGSEFLPGKRY